MALSQSDLKIYEDKLSTLQRELEAELGKLKQDLDFGSDTEGVSADEESDEAEEIANSLSISEELRERLEAVSAALERIKDGAYGVCVKCSQDIESSVLDVVPESSLCIACKKAF